MRIGREGCGQRGAVVELAGVDVDGGPADLARGEIATDLDDVAAGFRPGGGETAGEDAGPGGAPDLFGIESGQAGGGGDRLDGAGDFGAEGDQAGAGVAAVLASAGLHDRQIARADRHDLGAEARRLKRAGMRPGAGGDEDCGAFAQVPGDSGDRRLGAAFGRAGIDRLLHTVEDLAR